MNKNFKKEITKLKKEKNAIVLVHNYQIPEVQDIADFLGDSLDLAKKATQTNAENIIFCGVDFMAESAKILNPDKNVILPDISATCPMAHMVDIDGLEKLKKSHPQAKVVCYINTTAETKTHVDICCTSSNGNKIVKMISSDEIIFIPDRNLGSFIQTRVPEKKMILWPGFCSTHNNITKKDILRLKSKYLNAEVLVHPECRLDVIDIADHALSTNGMVNYVKKSDTKEFIIGTEKDICYRLKNENPKKEFYPIKSAVCPNMKKVTAEKVLKSLETLEPKIKLSNKIIKEAKKPLQKMMNFGRGD